MQTQKACGVSRSAEAPKAAVQKQKAEVPKPKQQASSTYEQAIY
jgi:hypothetical protein